MRESDYYLGRKLEPHDYRLARNALSLIAEPIGRVSGLIWRRK